MAVNGAPLIEPPAQATPSFRNKGLSACLGCGLGRFGGIEPALRRYFRPWGAIEPTGTAWRCGLFDEDDIVIAAVIGEDNDG